MPLTLLAAIVFLVVSAGASDAAIPLDPESVRFSALAVRVYDVVGLRAVDILRAQQTVDRLLGRVGVRVDWTVCSVNQAERPDEACAAPTGAEELIVRLTNGSAAVSAAALGFAYTPGIVATALVDRIDETARRTLRPMPSLLGAVITHELVHLLLGAMSHSTSGVMLPSWTDRAIQAGQIFLIELTADERRALRHSLRERLPAPPSWLP
jgi:hypothetical protein